MTIAAADASYAPQTAGAGSRRRPTRGPVKIIQTYVVLLVLIPPTYIIGPLGAVGTPATVVALVALMVWGVAVLTPGDHLCRTVIPVRIVMGLLVGSILLSYGMQHLRRTPGPEVLSSDRTLLLALSWAGVGLLAAEGLRDRGELYRVLRALVGAVAVMAVVGFLQFRFGIDLAVWARRIPGLHENVDFATILDRSGFRRPAGTAAHPIEFGCVIAMALPFALHLARFDQELSLSRRWLPVAAIAVGIPVAVSRSAVLGAVVVAVVIFVGLEPRVRPRALGITAAFLVVIYATTPGLLGTLRNLFVYAGSDDSITYRTNDYEAVAEYVRQSPWVGRGPGTFLPNTYLVLDNQYLMSAIETGLIGLSIMVVYLLATSFLGRGARHRTADPVVRDLGQALAAAGLASAVTAFTFDGFSFRMFAGVIPLSLGVAGALWMMERTAQRRVGVEQFLETGRWDPPLDEQLPLTVPDTHVGDWSAEGALPSVVGAAPLPGPTYGGEDGGHDSREPHDPGGELGWLTTTVAEPAGIAACPSRGEPTRAATNDDGHDNHDLHRVVALVGAAIAVAVLAALPFTLDKGSDEPDVAVTRIAPRTAPAPTSTSTTPTVTTEPSPSAAARPTIIAPAGPARATVVPPLRTETTAEAWNRPASSLSPSPPTAPPATVPPTTVPPTTVPPTTVPPTTVPPTTVPPTTVPPTTTTTTTTPPPSP